MKGNATTSPSFGEMATGIKVMICKSTPQRACVHANLLIHLFCMNGVLLLIFYRTHTKYAVRKLGNLLNGKTVGLQWRMCSRVWNEGKTLGKTLYQTNIFKCFSELIQALLIHAQHQQNITPKSHSRLWKQNLNANNYSPKSEYCCGFFQTAACDWNCDM